MREYYPLDTRDRHGYDGCVFVPANLEEALTTLGAVLDDRGHHASLALIGGGALLLAGYIQRPTMDLDVVAIVRGKDLLTAEPLPKALIEAVHDVATALDLEPAWLNPGPTSILRLGLPQGFIERCEQRRYDALEVFIAGRLDQVALKLYAAADHWPARRNKHLDDLRRLRASSEELRSAAAWCRTHDPSAGFLTMQLEPLLALLESTDD